MNKVVKYILIVFSVFLALLLLLGLFTQTSIFRRVVKEQVVKGLNETIAGQVRIETLKGNFFNRLSIHGLFIGENQIDTLIAIDDLFLEYSLWPLLKKEVRIKTLIIGHPVVKLKQSADSLWNYEKFFQTKAPSSENESSQSSSFSFFVNRLDITDGRTLVVLFSDLKPIGISDLNMELEGGYSPQSIYLNLLHLGFKTSRPIPDLQHLQFNVALRDSVFSLSDFALETKRNTIQAKGAYSDRQGDSSEVFVQSEPFDSEDLTWLLPDFRIGVKPRMDLQTKLQDKDLSIDWMAEYEGQRVRLSGQLTNFLDFLSDSSRFKVDTDLKITFDAYEPSKWFLLSGFPVVLNGEIDITGNGLKNSLNPLTVNANFSNSMWEDYPVKEFQFSGLYKSGATNFESRIETKDGVFDVSGNAQVDIPHSPIQLKIMASRFPLGRFLPAWGDSTLVNMSLSVTGRGNSLESLSAGFNLTMNESVVAGVPVGWLLARGRMDSGDLVLDTLEISNGSLAFYGAGEYSREGLIHARVESKINDFIAFRNYVDQPGAWGFLGFDGEVEGVPDSLMAKLNIYGEALRYDTIVYVDEVEVRVPKFLIKDGAMWGHADILAEGISAGGIEGDSIKIEGQLKNDAWEVNSTLWITDSLWLQIGALGELSAPLDISIPELNIQTPYDLYSLEGDSIKLSLGPEHYMVKDFNLTGQKDKGVGLRANGEFTLGDSVQIDVSVDNLDISVLEKSGVVQQSLSGRASLELQASGPISNPELKLDLLLSDLAIDPARISQMHLNMRQSDDTLRAYTAVHSKTGDSLFVEIMSPVKINGGDSLMVASYRDVSGRVVANQIRPSAFFEFDDPDNQYFRALVDMDIKLSGQLLNPVLKGFLNVSGGELSLPSYGLRYSDVKLMARVDSNRIELDSLFAARDKGTFLVFGKGTFKPNLWSGILSGLDITIKARDFFLSRHPNHEIEINGDTWFKLEEGNPTFGGEITVLQSRLYLPALLNMGGEAAMDEPMLVEALKKNVTDSIEPEDGDLRMAAKEGKGEINLLKPLKGKINIKIPRNSWLRSEDMNLELYGDLDLLKNDEYFEVFGILGITRGYYTLYGRKLIINEGELTFTGGKETNPRIELEAGYTFRGVDKQKKELIMTVSGTAFEPKLLFTLNGTEVSERDAMAYLIFNQSFDELSFGSKEGLSVNLPTAMLSGLVSAQLTKTIGEKFNVDMLEIQAGDDWESATFMVGKYISNNLFVTYQRGFGVNEDGALFHQTVSLEYEIIRNLLIRLTQGDFKDSGIDVILKFEKK
ncbi:translocation/assembly module TamB domain-containing protein [Thermophagus xiamenensis]|uniref:Autotransporter translocation and assembly factor TamB n=1 Tax=Thermophagus xiamenensis TaxID=385682 RepID=A0A1I1YQI3_9BACT|nr:translocation/assembly module TamB domain-containing protein [Thermophagus xiamenensis]SFE21572.1 Autotransporter translocation and assembly factor TamB [Thermophagus xiamenensis]